MARNDELNVSINVEGIDIDEQQQRVLDVYQENMETFIRKNQDYGGSFETAPMIESILKNGSVQNEDMPELIARQMFVRGMLDKMSRFYQLAFENDGAMVEDESVEDTLMDMSNYALMLVSLFRKYNEEINRKLIDEEDEVVVIPCSNSECESEIEVKEVFDLSGVEQGGRWKITFEVSEYGLVPVRANCPEHNLDDAIDGLVEEQKKFDRQMRKTFRAAEKLSES